MNELDIMMEPLPWVRGQFGGSWSNITQENLTTLIKIRKDFREDMAKDGGGWWVVIDSERHMLDRAAAAAGYRVLWTPSGSLDNGDDTHVAGFEPVEVPV